jgi:hypothetical protein
MSTTKLRKISSLGSLCEKEMEELLHPKKKRCENCCSFINYISLIPTLVYNAFSIYYIVSFLGLFENDCSYFQKVISSILNWNIVSLIKAMIFLLCSKIICGAENDCNILCLVIKIFTSYVPCIFFLLYLYDDPVKNSIIEKEKCTIYENFILFTLQVEKVYFYFITSLIAMIPVGSLLMVCKELWRSRKYHSD